MVDFTKNKKGDVVAVHCCDSCARAAGLTPKTPADSGKASWFCEVCGHHGIGSLTDCEIGDWLRLRPMQPNRARLWQSEGGRACPIGWGGCSQLVFVDIKTGEYDYGDPGGPGHQDCMRNCRHGMIPPQEGED